LDEGIASSSFEKLLLYKHSEQKNPNARFQLLIPSLLEQNLYFKNDSHSKTFFKTLLKHATSKNESLRNESFAHLITCFKRNVGYYEDWVAIAAEFQSETNNLMAYILTNWDKEKLANKLNGNALNKTVVSIREKYSKLKKSHETETVNATSEKLAEKLKKFKNSKGGDSSSDSSNGGSSSIILAITSIVSGAAVVYYLSMNCCQIDQCKNFVLGNPQFQLNEFFHC